MPTASKGTKKATVRGTAPKPRATASVGTVNISGRKYTQKECFGDTKTGQAKAKAAAKAIRKAGRSYARAQNGCVITAPK